MPRELTTQELIIIMEEVYSEKRIDKDEIFEEEIETMVRITKKTMEAE